MQVSDSPAAPPVDTAAKAEVPAIGDESSTSRRTRPGRSFRGALERARSGSTSGDAYDLASAAALAGWFRAETTAASQGASATTARAVGVGAARAVDRILIGAGPDGAEARIRIAAGALAGTELHLSTAATGHTVEARLLTHAASSRQTLAVVLEDIRSRLRDKGIVLSTAAAPPARAPGQRLPAGAALDESTSGPWYDRAGLDR